MISLEPLALPADGSIVFPRTDAGQFVINFKAPSGTKLDATEEEAAKVEGIVRRVVSKHDMGMTVTNIGVDPGSGRGIVVPLRRFSGR